MDIDIPTSWGDDLLALIAMQSQNGHTFQVYGALPSAFPTGRPDDVPLVSRETAVVHLRSAGELGIETNYLINGAKGARHFSEHIETVREYFSWVTRELRPDLITVSDPDLQIALHREFGWESFCVSAIAGVRDQRGLEQWLERTKGCGAVRSVVLHHDVTQSDGADIRAMADAARACGVRAKLMVTESCYGGCQVRQAHYGFVGQPAGARPSFDPFQTSCMMKRLPDPASLLDLAGFITPDEISSVAALTGIDSFKITGRSCSPDWIARACDYYCSGRTPSNLFEIVVFTAPLLRETLGIDVERLFYLDSDAYRRFLRQVRPLPPEDRQAFRRETASTLLLSGLLRVNDPGAIYEAVDGGVRLRAPGKYFAALEAQLREGEGSRQREKIADVVIGTSRGVGRDSIGCG